MNIGARLRDLREERKLSQGDLEERTGLLRAYISRAEHGHITPSVETLEKLARAFDLKLYQLLYDGEDPPKAVEPPKGERRAGESRRDFAKRTRLFSKLRRLLPRLDPTDRDLLLFAAMKMAQSRKRRSGS